MSDDLAIAHQTALRQAYALRDVLYRMAYLQELSQRMELSPLACASLVQAQCEVRQACGMQARTLESGG